MTVLNGILTPLKLSLFQLRIEIIFLQFHLSDLKHELSLMFVMPKGLLVYIKLS